ncbi:hypothetical protein GF371_01990 [Candidatus Woesearchaeota archaeon]|nr:hypothetical protein [Candidatus Woesearchaeota archaeon]
MNIKKDKVKTQTNSDSHYSLKLLVPLVLLILFIFVALVYRPSFTGMTVGDFQGHEKLLNLRFTENSNMNFALDKIPVSLKLAGSCDGTARVYLVDGEERILILNTASLEPDLDGVAYFENYCVDSCDIDVLSNEVRLAVEVDEGELLLDELLYSSLNDQNNALPVWEGRTTFLIEGVATEEIVLSNYYADADEEDSLIFFTKTVEVPFDVSLTDDVLKITTNTKSQGDHRLSVFASDGKEVAETVLDIVVYGIETVEEEEEASIIVPFELDQSYEEQMTVKGMFSSLTIDDGSSDNTYSIGDAPFYTADFSFINNDVPITAGACEIAFDPSNTEAYGPAEQMQYNEETAVYEFTGRSFDTSTTVGYKISCTGTSAAGQEETLQLSGKTYFFNAVKGCRELGSGDSGRNFFLAQDIDADEDCFKVAGSDILIDCKDHAISGSGVAFDVGADNVVIKNCRASGFETAVRSAGHSVRVEDNSFMDGTGDAVSLSGEDALIIGNTIKNTEGDAVELAGALNCVIVNNIIDTTTGQGSQGISVTGNSNSNLIKTNNFMNVAEDAIRISNSDGVVVKENTFSELNGRAVSTPLLCGGDGCTDIQILGNQIDDISTDGIYLLGVSNSKVNDNIINNQHGDSTNWGILLSGSDDVLINNNVLHTVDNGIGLATTKNSIVENNRVEESSTGAGISLTADSSGNTVSNNLLYGLEKGLIVVESHNNVVSDNHAQGNNVGFKIDELSANNQYVNNRVEESITDGIIVGDEGVQGADVANTFKENSVVSNAGNGFVVLSSGSEYSGNTVFENYGNGFALRDSAVGNRLDGNSVVSNKISGIHLMLAGGNEITSNSMLSNVIGISIQQSSGNVVNDNDLEDNKYGIYILGAENNNILENKIMKSSLGLYLMSGSLNNMIIENEFNENNDAVKIDSANLNRIASNLFTDNAKAVWIVNGEHNEIVDNKLSQNDEPVVEERFGRNNVVNSNT